VVAGVSELVNLSSDDYHADFVADVPTLSSSIAKILLTQSPAHAWAAHPRLNPEYVKQDRPEFDFGTAVHKLFLENDNNCVQVVAADSWRTKAAQESRDLARADGLIPLLDKDMIHVEKMVAALRQRVSAVESDPPMFADGLMEHTLLWNEDGVACRARLDWLRDDRLAIDDLKTTSRSANPQTWARQLYSMNYDLQAAFYIRGVRALGVTSDPVYRLAVIEKSPPYALSILTLSPAGLALAHAKVDRALLIWKRCMEMDHWPAYPQKVATAEPPSWAEEQFWASMEGEEQ
jgi:hypothetical protein